MSGFKYLTGEEIYNALKESYENPEFIDKVGYNKFLEFMNDFWDKNKIQEDLLVRKESFAKSDTVVKCSVNEPIARFSREISSKMNAAIEYEKESWITNNFHEAINSRDRSWVEYLDKFFGIYDYDMLEKFMYECGFKWSLGFMVSSTKKDSFYLKNCSRQEELYCRIHSSYKDLYLI